MAPTSYSLTIDIDVTELIIKLKIRGKRFFPTYLWLVIISLYKQVEFKVINEEGKLGSCETLTSLYAGFHDNYPIWMEYDDNYEAFYQQYLDNQNQFGNNHGILLQVKTPPPANACTV